MKQLAGKRALVTGASGGLGREIAYRLAAEGADLVLIARRETELEQTAEQIRSQGRNALTCVGDVCDPELRSNALTLAEEELGGLDLLVNNAGVGAHGRFHESDPTRLEQVFRLNVFAVADWTRAAIPLLQQRSDPAVINVGSVLGWRGAAHNSEYCASKFALRGFSESIRPELAQLGIHLLHASPGPIDTEFFDHMVERREGFPWRERRGVSPEQCADKIVKALLRRRSEVIIGFQAWWFVHAARLAPGLMDRVMNRYG